MTLEKLTFGDVIAHSDGIIINADALKVCNYYNYYYYYFHYLLSYNVHSKIIASIQSVYIKSMFVSRKKLMTTVKQSS